MLKKLSFVISLGLLSTLSACSYFYLHEPAENAITDAAIASAHPLATEAGMTILASGGNAFDAAVAVAASLGVVEPYNSGIGGGGFWLLYEAKTHTYRFIDARETAPQSAHADLYVNAQGRVERDHAMNGPRSAAIPGQAAAFVHLAQHYGQLPLSKTLAPAIEQAELGFSVYPHYQTLAQFRLPILQRFNDSARLFLQNNQVPELGYVVRQPELAHTLKALANDGFSGFYQGAIAQKMLSAVNAQGGHWRAEDLSQYRVIEREPLHVRYGDLEVISAPPPSSGGIALLQMLNMLNYFQWEALPEAEQTHLLSEIMRRAYFDRATHLGDPDFIDIPTTQLLSEHHAEQWINSIRMEETTPSSHFPLTVPPQEGTHTTHFSVLDQYGNMVSATLSINLPFGSAFTVPGTGILLNNHMDDFSAQPGSANAYGLVGNHANAIAAGKRPLSSMTPTIINSPQSTAILGTPGGSRIISMVLLGVLEHLQGKPVQDWVARPRIHHQYLPDQIEYEPNALSEESLMALAAKGHLLKKTAREYGNMQAILWDKEHQQVNAASDPRGYGASQVRTRP